MHVTYNHEYERKLRAAFIGCGGHSFRNVYPTLKYAPVDLVATVDVREGAAEDYGRMFGARAAYTDYRKMLESEKPDIVFVVTSYDENSHPRYPGIAMDCMRAGANVWIEKPPSATSDEIREMMAVEAETGKFTMVGYKKMFFPANVKAAEIAHRPEFGGVTSVTARYPQHLPPFESRTDAAAMQGFLDHIQHPWSLLLLIAGPAESIAVEYSERVGSSITNIRFKSGAIGSLHLAHGQSPRSFMERTEIVGWGNNVVVDNNIRLTWYRQGAANAGYGREGDYFANDDDGAVTWEPEFSLGNLYNKGIFLLGYAPEILEFCNAVLESRRPAHAGLADALHIMNVYEAYCRPSGDRVTVRED